MKPMTSYLLQQAKNDQRKLDAALQVHCMLTPCSAPIDGSGGVGISSWCTCLRSSLCSSNCLSSSYHMHRKERHWYSDCCVKKGLLMPPSWTHINALQQPYQLLLLHPQPTALAAFNLPNRSETPIFTAATAGTARVTQGVMQKRLQMLQSSCLRSLQVSAESTQ